MPLYVEFTVVLRTGESLTEQAVSSPNGEFSLIHEFSGNVSVRRNVDALLVWETGTGYRPEPTTTIQPGRWRGQGEGLAPAGQLALREDNTLAVLNHEGTELWVSPTREFPYLSLVLDDNGILTLMSKYGHLVWQSTPAPKSWPGWSNVPDGRRLRRGQSMRGQTLTSANGKYVLAALPSGRLQLRTVGGPVLWGWSMGKEHGLTLTEDGRLYHRAPGGETLGLTWHEQPAEDVFELYVADDGRITCVDEHGTVRWQAPDPKAGIRQVSPLRPPYAVILRAGEHLSERAVSSPNGEYSLVHQHDGNLVLYRHEDREAVWASDSQYQDSADRAIVADGFSERPGRLLLREHGELVVLRVTGEQVWSAPAVGHTLVVTDAGRASLLGGSGDVVWQTPEPEPLDDEEGEVPWTSVPDGRRLRRGEVLRGQTLISPNGAFTLVSNQEGFLYLRQAEGPVLWIHHLGWLHGLELTEDGILQVRNWDEEELPVGFLALPEDFRVTEMVVSDDGRLTFTDDAGEVVWAGPPPQEAGPYPELPRTRSAIALDGYDSFRPLVVRTDFGDETDRLLESDFDPDGFYDDGPDLFVVADPVWTGASPEEVVAALMIGGGDLPGVLFILDQESRQGSLLAVDLSEARSPEKDGEDPYRPIPRFRIRPGKVVAMTANLALHNQDFSDYDD